MSNTSPIALPWHRREDTWAIFIALGLVLAVTAGFFLGASPFVGATALSIPTWSGSLAKVTATFIAHPAGPVALFAVFLSSAGTWASTPPDSLYSSSSRSS
jgi:hypothetical protein